MKSIVLVVSGISGFLFFGPDVCSGNKSTTEAPAPSASATTASATGTAPPTGATTGDPPPTGAGAGAGAGATAAATAGGGGAPTPKAGGTGTAAAPAAGPCAQLAVKCASCPQGTAVHSACNVALSAGKLDQTACTNALNDKDIKAQCAGGGTPPTPTATATATTTAAAAGVCAQLQAKCVKCPAGTAVHSACNVALNAGKIDQTACKNALADKDINAQCK